MRAINVLLAILVSLLIAVGVFEGGLRLVGLGPTKTLNEFDSKLGWVKRSDSKTNRSTSEFDVTFEVNSLGLRDDPMDSPAKPDGTFRVIALGDSFTLGFTVEREDLFVDQIEMAWNADGRKVDVINTGTEGYSTDQETVWLLENGEAYQPDLVLLFPYDNDIYWNGQTEYYGKHKPRFDGEGNLDHPGPFDEPASAGLEKTFAIAHLADKIFGRGPQGHTYTPEKGSRMLQSEFAPLVLPPTGFITDSVVRTKGSLIALKKKCEELGARLVVVPIPSHSAIDDAYADKFGPAVLGVSNRDDWMPDMPVQTMLELCKTVEIDALDSRQALKDAMAATGNSMYYTTDWHLNPEGNLAFANFLLGGLDNLGVFPAARVGSKDLVAVASANNGAGKTGAGIPTWMKVFMGLWVILTTIYYLNYPDDAKWLPPLQCGGMLALVFGIVLGGEFLIGKMPPAIGSKVAMLFVLWLVVFILYKIGRRMSTILELLKAFTLRGHWYLMPLVVVLMTIGSLLVVAASSPLVAPFIYTLF
ncbi:MAG: hypothetical protein ACI8X5_003761 [Planctomycetota bacterium]|jgi:hypothetical protein